MSPGHGFCVAGTRAGVFVFIRLVRKQATSESEARYGNLFPSFRVKYDRYCGWFPTASKLSTDISLRNHEIAICPERLRQAFTIPCVLVAWAMGG